MRPTQPRPSEMPGGKAYMGWWGDLKGPKQRGVVQYAQSPFRQRAFAGALKGYLYYGYLRAAGHFPYIAIPFGIGYAIYSWGKSYDAWQSSKAGHIALTGREGGHH